MPRHLQTTNQGTQGRYADIHGLHLYYEIHGLGFPLVLLHGAFTTIEVFSTILPVLAATRQIIAVEQQGHGHTADIDRPLSFEFMADDTAALLAFLGIEHTDVFGYSAGGSVALQLAVRHPRLVRKLALASTAYNLDGYSPEMQEGMQHASPDGFPPQMREAYERVAPNPEGWTALIAKGAQQARGSEGLQGADLQAITAPSLVLVADGDIIRHEHAETLAHLLHTNLMVIPNSDHSSYLGEHPDDLLTQLTAFLNAPLPQNEYVISKDRKMKEEQQ